MASGRVFEDVNSLADISTESHIVIIGSGIVGSGIAAYLSESPTTQITVVDNSISELCGSTGYAPGLVGQLNELPTLTQLAKISVSEYRKISGGFDAVGGLEIANSPESIAIIEHRLHLSHNAGLPAQILTSEQAATMVTQWHREDGESKALYFSRDGTANPEVIVREYQRMARSRGVAFVEANVLSILQEHGQTTGIMTSKGLISAKQIVVAAGIWTPQLLKPLGINLPIIPVAHPYVHGPQRPRRDQSSPFVRWPRLQIYARDHGDFDGFGSYDHSPIAVENLHSKAIASWEPNFDDVVAEATSLFPENMNMAGMRCFNGVFAVTPDGLPLAGQVQQLKGLWVTSAVWITHAGGIARLIADMLLGKTVDEEVKSAVDPNRFIGRDANELKVRALSTYNDIYNVNQ